jgi:hypothetical protein
MILKVISPKKKKYETVESAFSSLITQKKLLSMSSALLIWMWHVAVMMTN